MLANGFHDIPPGKLATVVTHLEMTSAVRPRDVPDPDDVKLVRISAPDLAWYRDLFLRVGGRDWLWTSRLLMTDDALCTILMNADVHLFAVETDGSAQGILELDFRSKGICELAFFGLAPALVGTGTGRWLMNHAIALAWAAPIRCLHVHTCTLDHPDALRFYLRSGFVAVRQQIEIMDDPRVTGILPNDAAPHWPVIV